MAINTLFRLDKIVLASGQEIHTLENEQQQFGIKLLKGRGAGEIWPNFLANQEQKPAISFSTPQLNTLLTNVGVAGAYGLTNVGCWLKKAAAAGNVARASTVHEKAVIASCCAYWSQIRLTHNGVGSAQVMLAPVFDGTNDPIVYTGSVALSGSIAATDYFGAGPVAINGTAIPGIQEITIDSGIQLEQLGDGSEEFDTFVGLKQGEVTITIRTLEHVNWSVLGLRGVALDGTDGIVAYARKYSAGGSRVANGTAEHLKFVGLTGKAIPVDLNGQQTNYNTDTLRVELIDSSNGAGLTTTVGSAIS